MFSYYPSHTYSPYDAGYSQALAEERAARNQYAAAVRAQEEARNRAARASLARQAYGLPYNSYFSEEDDLPHPSHRYGLTPQQLGAILQERQRRELLEAEKERERQRALEERRRQLMEEERMRAMVELERRRMEQDEMNRRSQSVFEQFYRNLAEVRAREHPEPNTPRRARTVSPPHREASPPAQPSESARSPVRDPKPVNTAERSAAAEKIQNFYRNQALCHKALKSIVDIDTRFQTLKSTFAYPQHLDFQGEEDSHITVDVSSLVLPTIEEEPSTPVDESDERQCAPSVPELAYSSNNTPVHQYEEELNRLLNKLDAVESGGDKVVREKRRDLVRKVEKEAQRIDLWKTAVWRAFRDAQATNAGHIGQDTAVPEVEEPKDEPMYVDAPAASDVAASDVVVADTTESADVSMVPHEEHNPSSPLSQLTSAQPETSISPATAEEPDFDVISPSESPVIVPRTLQAASDPHEDEGFTGDDKADFSQDEEHQSPREQLRRTNSEPTKRSSLGDIDWKLSDDFIVC